METLGQLGICVHSPMGPYLLGKSIEWKQIYLYRHQQRKCRPYLLGKSIEWKLL
uniref:Uncharacterized protein n=1 Tax=Cyanothece sp. (strain PCC 7425 / ATCC 29141) TaxID=395961 RepID=B8HYV9_CYAP4